MRKDAMRLGRVDGVVTVSAQWAERARFRKPDLLPSMRTRKAPPLNQIERGHLTREARDRSEDKLGCVRSKAALRARTGRSTQRGVGKEDQRQQRRRPPATWVQPFPVLRTLWAPPNPPPTSALGDRAQWELWRTHGGPAEQEVGVSDVGRRGLQLGTHVDGIGEEPVEAELHPCPAGEGHRFAQWLWKGKPRGVSSSEGPTDTTLQTGVPEGHRDPTLSTPQAGTLPAASMAHHRHVPTTPEQLLPRDRLGLSGTGLPSECV